MEQQAEYTTKPTTFIPRTEYYCRKCSTYLGDEYTVSWHHRRRGAIKSLCFVRKVNQLPVATLWVRGEIICQCGEREKWKSE